MQLLPNNLIKKILKIICNNVKKNVHVKYVSTKFYFNLKKDIMSFLNQVT